MGSRRFSAWRAKHATETSTSRRSASLPARHPRYQLKTQPNPRLGARPAVPVGLIAALRAGLNPGWTLVVGLAVFALVFAVNSAVHSYLVLAYTGRRQCCAERRVLLYGERLRQAARHSALGRGIRGGGIRRLRVGFSAAGPHRGGFVLRAATRPGSPHTVL